MEFTQTKNKRWHKVWVSGDYRISLNRKPFGIRVNRHYYACVKSPAYDGKQMWDFAGARRPFKTFEAAVKSCEVSEKYWRLFMILSGESGPRAKKLDDLRERARLRKVYLSTVPWSISKIADGRLLAGLNPQPKSKGGT